MSTSLKPIFGRQIRGMRHLESKISDLQNQYQLLLKERQQEITTIIFTLDLASLEDPFLIGGLLFLKDKVTGKYPTDLSVVDAWRDAGEKFLRRSKPKVCPRESTGDCSHPRGKQEEAFPRIPSEKNTSPKQTPPPQSTHQPPQKPPQSRDE